MLDTNVRDVRDAITVNEPGRLTGKLSEKGESHSNWPDFSWEDFGDIEVHGSIAQCPKSLCQWKIRIGFVISLWMAKHTPGRPDTKI